jgi:hypothetical protein
MDSLISGTLPQLPLQYCVLDRLPTLKRDTN